MKHIIGLRIGNRDEIYSYSIDSKGYLHSKHGLNSKELWNTKFPSNSFPLWWKKINGAKSYALLVESYDSAKEIGVPFICWTAVNIKENELVENKSLLDWVKWQGTKSDEYSDDCLWQGYNSSCINYVDSNNKNVKIKNLMPKMYANENHIEACMFHGPSPRFYNALYVVRIYGLDVEAKDLEYIKSFDPMIKEKLNKPYFPGDFFQAITPHIIGTWTLVFKYKKREDEKLLKEGCKKLNVDYELAKKYISEDKHYIK